MNLQYLVKKSKKLRKKGRLTDALLALDKALEIAPDNISVLHEAGEITLGCEEYFRAISYYEKIIRLRSSDVVALGNCGIAYYKLERHEAAIRCYENIIRTSPDNVSANFNIALSYLEIGERDAAIHHLDVIIKKGEKISSIHTLKAQALFAKGLFEQSITEHGVALELDSNNIPSLAGMVEGYSKLGDKAFARKLLGTTESLHPDLLVAQSEVVDGNDVLLVADKISAAISREKLNAQQKRKLYFSAGKLYDKSGAYDKAFSCYSKGNRLVSRYYDPAADDECVTQIISEFDSVSNYLKSLCISSESRTGDNLIFIVGMPRSGTSLLERMIGVHAEILPVGERSSIPEIVALMSGDKSYPSDLGSVLAGAGLDEYRNMYFSGLDLSSNQYVYVTDKLPHNFLYLGLIKALFPKCKVIHCMRDKYDVCLSNYMQYFSSSLSYPYTIKGVANHYLNYERIMRYWSECGIDCYAVSYESLVSNVDDTLFDVFEYLGLDFDAGCLDYTGSDQITRTASADQVARPLYLTSIRKWKNYEAHLQELFDILGSPE